MARGGYIRTEAALDRLFRVLGDEREVSRLLADAMASGAIPSREQPQLEPDEEQSEGLVLRDLGLGPINRIHNALGM